MLTQRREEKRERTSTHAWGGVGVRGVGETPSSFGSSFYMFFSSPLGLPFVNWASQECCCST